MKVKQTRHLANIDAVVRIKGINRETHWTLRKAEINVRGVKQSRLVESLSPRAESRKGYTVAELKVHVKQALDAKEFRKEGGNGRVEHWS
jgi:hypothetical protein